MVGRSHDKIHCHLKLSLLIQQQGGHKQNGSDKATYVLITHKLASSHHLLFRPLAQSLYDFYYKKNVTKQFHIQGNQIVYTYEIGQSVYYNKIQFMQSFYNFNMLINIKKRLVYLRTCVRFAKYTYT